MKRVLCVVGWHHPLYRKINFIPRGWSVTCQRCGKTKP